MPRANTDPAPVDTATRQPAPGAAPPPRIPTPTCPRCAYDLSGLTTAWTDSCPLRATCSECGLAFHWPDILREDRQLLPWLYEHALHWWRLDKACATAARALLPWKFWSDVRVHRRLAPSRLWIWLPMCLGAVYLASALIVLLPGLVCTQLPPPGPPVWVQFTYPLGARGASGIVQMDAHGNIPVQLPGGAATTLSLPAPPLLPILIQTPVGRIVLTDRSIEIEYATLIDSAAPGVSPAPQPNQPPPKPDLGGAIGTNYDFVISFTPFPSSPPPSLQSVARQSAQGLFLAGSSYSQYWQKTFLGDSPFLSPLAFALAAAAIVLACPSEWKLANVRPAHLLRVSAYSLAPMVVIYLAYALTWAAQELIALLGVYSLQWWTGRMRFTTIPEQFGRWLLSPPTSLVTALALWSSMFWWFALRRGLSLNRSFLLWLFITIAGWAAIINTLVARTALLMDP